MVIQTDTRQQMNRKHHQVKEQWFLDNGYEVIHSKMLVGDYQIPSNGSVVVDSKQHCGELYQDLITDHKRFRAECENAQRWNIKLYILIENEQGFKVPKDIIRWRNPLMYAYWQAVKKGVNRKPPTSNQQLLKIMHTMTKKYGVEFVFCSTAEAGAKIVELLTKGATNDNSK